MRKIFIGLGILLILAIVMPVVAGEPVPVDPASVDVDLLPGASTDIDKTVTTPEYPPVLDLLLLEDETGSFGDDIATMQGGKASEIWDGISAEVADFQGGVAGFRDFARDGWGFPNDWVYRRVTDLTTDKTTWLAGVGQLTAPPGAGYDDPEAQLAALKSGADGHAWDSNGNGLLTDPIDTPAGMNPTWRTGSTHIIMLVTDNEYHVNGDSGGWPGPTYAETITELNDAFVHVIILKAPSLNSPDLSGYVSLASDTGGSVKPLATDSSDIVAATLDALDEITTDVWWVKGTIDPEISITFDREVEEDVIGGTLVEFTETITADECALAGDYSGSVDFYANSNPDAGTPVGTQDVSVTVLPKYTIPVDIQPTSCPNAFNRNQKGLEPVAIPGTEDFDVTTIDPSTVKLNGVSPIRWSYEDVTTPYTDDECGCWEEGPDGYMDLVLHFDSQAFAGTLSGVNKGDTVPVHVTGDTSCGSFAGFDCVWVVK